MRRNGVGTALRMAAVLGATVGLAAACVDSPAEPTPAPLLQGDYVLVVDVSSVCDLPTTHFQWSVQARTVGTGAGAQVRITLPPGDDAVDMSVTYTTDPSSTESVPTADQVRGSLVARRASFDEELSVTIDSQVRGTVTDAGGRGRVEGGTFNGTLSLTDQPEEDDRTGDALGSCTAADHSWSLVTP